MSFTLRIGIVVASLAATSLAPNLESTSDVPSTFGMCVDHSGTPTPPRWQEQLLAASVASLDPSDRSTLTAELEAANVRWEARANPLGVDFEDDSPDARLEGWLARGPNGIDVAISAATSPWCATDGFCVRVVDARQSCPGTSRPASASERDRARFIAWQFGHAIRLRARSEEDARSSTRVLRKASRSSSFIGLVVHTKDESNEPDSVSLREAWRSHERLKSIVEDRSSGDRDPTDGLVFPSTDIVVLPRLAAVSTEGALEGEALRVAPQLRVVSR